MENKKNDMFENYSERIKRLALFEPLYSLNNKRRNDKNGKTIEMYDLGLLTLLFFFESKLRRNTETGVSQLSMFLYECLNERYELENKDYIKLSREVIDTFRPTNGKRLSKSFYNYETSKDDVIYFSILKAGKSIIEMNMQFYELDEDGLELIFSTREYFSEYQISISQMLLRKQLEKGEFVLAMRQIDEMLLSVDSLRQRMIKMKKDIKRNITSEQVLNRYRKLITDINYRLESEHKEFEELREFVAETIRRLRSSIKVEKDREIYQKALSLNNALENVHNEHNQLLNESIKIKSATLISAKEALYFVGVESFNFNKEVVGKVVSEPISLEQVHMLAKPFLKLEIYEGWSPLSVFFPQRIYSREENIQNQNYLEIDEKPDLDKKNTELVNEKIMQLLVLYLGSKVNFTLEEFIDYIKVSDYSMILETRYFYDFWINLHQLSPINITYEVDDQTHNFLALVITLEAKYEI
ncbi:MAG: hypothetical protein WBA54_10530 [Acidaminobacteraceae bacterium]